MVTRSNFESWLLEMLVPNIRHLGVLAVVARLARDAEVFDRMRATFSKRDNVIDLTSAGQYFCFAPVTDGISSIDPT